MKDKRIRSEIAIIGAGPAGVSTALFLAKAGIPHMLIDKAGFPRDKICGDGLSGKVIGLLREINPSIIEEISQLPDQFLPSWGVSFTAPNGKGIDLPFMKDVSSMKHAPGFVAKRIDFDNFLLSKIDPRFTDIRLETEVLEIEPDADCVKLKLKHKGKTLPCKAEVVIGADGANSIVSRKLAQQKIAPEHQYAGLRAYYENVTGMHIQNFIELIFIKEALPGYLWIFPLPNNQANVGIGIISRDLKKKKLNLKRILKRAVETNPLLKERFKNARLVSEPTGWRLPIGAQKRSLSGNRYLLTGDAAALVDPFTGEGIGNAILSGKFAAQTLQDAYNKNDYSAMRLRKYDEYLYNDLWDELQNSSKIQYLVRVPRLFNFVINRVHNNQMMLDTFSSMFNNVDMRAKLRSPLFYFRLLLNRGSTDSQ